MAHLHFTFALVVALAACGDDGTAPSDTGAEDTATADSSTGDSAASDTSTADSTVGDVGPTDGMVSDASPSDAMVGDSAPPACSVAPVDRMACRPEGTYCPIADGCCTCATISVCSREPAWYCISSTNDAACPDDPPPVSDGPCPMERLVCNYCTARGAVVRECTRRGWVEGSLAICR